MEIVNFRDRSYDIVGASGICPHCGRQSYFKPIGSPYTEPFGVGEQVVCNPGQCEACKQFILIVGGGRPNTPKTLLAFYPHGAPDQRVEEGIPPTIAEDFLEALRCRWVRAFKATVTMCRRAIQASCIEKKANPKAKLFAQIDELASKGLITEPLRLFAHEVRLEGNDGAHPYADGLTDVTEKDADDIIAFTKEYLHHVYVMPEMLARRKPSGAGL